MLTCDACQHWIELEERFERCRRGVCSKAKRFLGDEPNHLMMEVASQDATADTLTNMVSTLVHGFRTELITGPKFGCVLHSELQPAS